jgi:hypothetical protein
MKTLDEFGEDPVTETFKQFAESWMTHCSSIVVEDAAIS